LNLESKRGALHVKHAGRAGLVAARFGERAFQQPALDAGHQLVKVDAAFRHVQRG
jgi:hypothetical protein